ncbi:MAG: hypothetical protein MZV63_40805 [Marinilabiliales bacterium]|nr:hypothetical protein [Marinilabiliales bacterium]
MRHWLNFEEKACAMLMTASSSDSSDFDEVKVKAGPEGARFSLIAARPLQEPVAWGGPIGMNTQEELNLAFSELGKQDLHQARQASGVMRQS